MNTATVPRWLRTVLWIVGGVNAVFAVVAVLSGQPMLAVSFGIAGGVCLVLAAVLPRSATSLRRRLPQ